MNAAVRAVTRMGIYVGAKVFLIYEVRCRGPRPRLWWVGLVLWWVGNIPYYFVFSFGSVVFSWAFLNFLTFKMAPLLWWARYLSMAPQHVLQLVLLLQCPPPP